MQLNRHTSIMFNVSVGIVSHLTLTAISLAQNHLSRFGVSHLAPKVKGKINKKITSPENQESQNA
jgi:hypothetical protein